MSAVNPVTAIDPETLHGVISDLLARDMTISVQAGELRISAPKGRMDDALLRRLREVKPALLKHLASGKQEATTDLPQVVAGEDPLTPYSLSDLQRGFYLGADPGMEFHVRPHCYMEWDIEAVDIDRYEAAWNAALRRRGGSIVTVMLDDADGTAHLAPLRPFEPIRFLRIDLRGADPDMVADSLAATRSAMERDELPLDRWPWCDWRTSLLDGGRARIHYNHNSFFSDGVGTQQLLREVHARYETPSLAFEPLEIGFGDCLTALARLEASAAGERAHSYWMGRIDTLPAPPPLPQLPHIERRCRSRLNRRDGRLSTERWSSLKRAANARGLSPTVALYTIYGLVLAHWSGSRHFVVNQMVTRRFPMHRQIMEVLGNFVSLYPLEIDLRAGEDFTTLALRLQDRLNSDMEHLAIGGMAVLAELNRRKGSPGRVPVPFVVASGLGMPGAFHSDYTCLETPQTQLDHQFWELNDGSMSAQWDVLEGFFPPGLIDAMWKAYFRVLEHLSQEPGAWDERHWPLTPPEQLAIREHANAQARLLPAPDAGERLHDGLFHHATFAPDSIALIADGTRFSYGALASLALALAHRIVERLGHGRPGQPVAIAMPKGWEQVVAVHAVLLAGHIYVPLAPDLPQARMRQTLALAGASVVLVAPRQDVQKSLAGMSVIPVETAATDMQRVLAPASSPFPRAAADDPAYIIFTSGSTGVPKGVAVSHLAALNTVADINRRFDLSPRDRVFGVSALTFDLSVYDLFGPPMAGATLVLPAAQEERSPDRWAASMGEHHVTVWNSAPALLQLLVATLEASEQNHPDALAFLRLALLSGDWIPVELPQRLRSLATPRPIRVVSLGGATEASIWSIWYDVERLDPEWASIPYGYPLAHQGWHVLDAALYPAPDWVAGELYIEGRGLAIGYWNDPEKSAAAFISHPATGMRLYRTGDLGRYRSDGAIEFLGRGDDQVKVQGFRIELGDIEATLCAHASVTAAVAFVRTGVGEVGQQLVACITVRRDASDEHIPGTLRRWATGRLPTYMVPHAIHVLDSIPLSANGKVDRKALANLDFRNHMAHATRTTTPPRTPVQVRLHALWTQLLAPPGPIGIEDDFFEIGGHSFLAVSLLNAINRDIPGRRLVLGDLMAVRTISGLARRLENIDTDAPTPGTIPLHRDTRAGSPLFLIHPAAGGVMCYRELASMLTLSCQGIEAVGLSGEAPPLSDLTVMVERYLALMRCTKPADAPWLIGGWSSGGVIASAIAERLERAGEAVNGLVLIDSPSPVPTERPQALALLRFFLEDLDIGYPMDRLGSLTQPDLAEAIDAAHDCLPTLPEQRQLVAIQGVFNGVLEATRQCTVTSLTAPILMLKAGEKTATEFAGHPDRQRADWGWSRISQAPISSVVLPTTHHGLLRHPALQETASCLQTWLANLMACER
ncbi:amino acid adenylation domain-containing protein [Verminephrobacter aporrectodeae subsp. tuberculatae]|uniref:non-ribosomal peptide synthetase n=1 Tax=Verminephrobacter aporrectodeae TaxID=1110389 RepID=UPI0022436DA6|nr:amino acid adenylation domain-containing protein [Verminephrobacter aporrectodeae]MCW8199467.1 amino acid adenylation domain-containing protein [Verminephrobacter aporrectodeae subsp. tuberculatae]